MALLTPLLSPCQGRPSAALGPFRHEWATHLLAGCLLLCKATSFGARAPTLPTPRTRCPWALALGQVTEPPPSPLPPPHVLL